MVVLSGFKAEEKNSAVCPRVNELETSVEYI